MLMTRGLSALQQKNSKETTKKIIKNSAKRGLSLLALFLNSLYYFKKIFKNFLYLLSPYQISSAVSFQFSA